jgi:hypothetical protein
VCRPSVPVEAAPPGSLILAPTKLFCGHADIRLWVFVSMKDHTNAPNASPDGRELTKDVQVLPERRSRERYELDTHLIASLVPEHTQRIHGRTLDISTAGLGGIFVADIEVGSHVVLNFHLPIAKEALVVEAVVRNRNGHRYGFEFFNVSGRDRLLIQKAVRVLALF